MWLLFFFSTGEEIRYSWDFFTDLLDNMADSQMLKLKEKDDVSVTDMRQVGTLERRKE